MPWGGPCRPSRTGYIQNEIQDAAYTYQRAIESGDQVVVGINQYQSEEKIELERLTVNPAIEQDQRKRLAALRQKRDSSKVSELLGHLDKAANGKDNLMPLLVACVENDITLGEICTCLRKVWGEYQPSTM